LDQGGDLGAFTAQQSWTVQGHGQDAEILPMPQPAAAFAGAWIGVVEVDDHHIEFTGKDERPLFGRGKSSRVGAGKKADP
jgi:hypothetical protein